MEKSIKGTQTEINLLTTFAGESQARMRYSYFAIVAKKEGYEQISAIFEETANQEIQHAKRMFKYLEGGMVEIKASYPAGIIGTTAQNLKAAAGGEHEEWSELYPKFADIAEAEGFKEIATMYRAVSKCEARHEARYLKLLANLESGAIFKREEKVKWVCRKCGFVHEGKSAPQNCPACNHPQAYFEIESENY